MATRQPPKPRKAAKTAPMTTTTARAEASPREIRQLIEQAAYYKAEARGFAPGHELDDWIAAEAEVRRRLEG
jgi:Protein of unknown function (DUF2934)